MKDARSHLEYFALRKGLLVNLQRPVKRPDRVSKPRLCIPTTWKARILKAYHDDLSHSDKWRTFHMIAAKYWWSRMYEEVRDWVRSCVTCQELSVKTAIPPKTPIKAATPNDIVAIDFWETNKITRNGNKCGVVMIDLYTKVIEAVPVADTSAKSAVMAIERNWIRNHSCPRNLLSDRDPAFIGTFSTEVNHAWGINKITTSSWHPQGDGEAECAVQSVKRILHLAVGS